MLTRSEIRQQGLGLNFRVLDPADGFRQDNSIWFGTCDTCGDRVAQSLHTDYWAHTAVIDVKYHTTGHILSQTSKQIDYCPLGDIVVD